MVQYSCTEYQIVFDWIAAEVLKAEFGGPPPFHHRQLSVILIAAFPDLLRTRLRRRQ